MHLAVWKAYQFSFHITNVILLSGHKPSSPVYQNLFLGTPHYVQNMTVSPSEPNDFNAKEINRNTQLAITLF